MESSLLKLHAETKMAIKDVTKRQFLKKETDVAKQQVEVNEIQTFKNPLYDEEAQKNREKRESDKYNDVVKAEYEIKGAEDDLVTKKKKIEMFEKQIRYYKNQISIVESTETEDDDVKADVGSINTRIDEIKKQIEDLTAEIKTLEADIKNKRNALNDLRIAQVT